MFLEGGEVQIKIMSDRSCVNLNERIACGSPFPLVLSLKSLRSCGMTRVILTGHAEKNGEAFDFKIGPWVHGIGLLIRRTGGGISRETGAGIWPKQYRGPLDRIAVSFGRQFQIDPLPSASHGFLLRN
jgi:hypothetical protein